MGRRPKPKAYLIMLADAVCCVSEDRVFDPDADPDKSLFDTLQCPVADDVLIAMRKAFSLTYPRNPFIDGIQAALAEIRKIGVEALKPMPEVLADLGLPPIPPITDDPAMSKTQVFKFVFARRDAVDIAVKFEGKRRRLLDIVEHQDATAVLTTLRSVVTATFAEAHDEDQHMAILHRIRAVIHAVLPAFNRCLEMIEIEPIEAHS